MAYVSLASSPLWIPPWIVGSLHPTSTASATDTTLDADEEELQFIGTVNISGGGSKTFGTSGSKIEWLPGNSITFAANSTLRVGVKKASQIDTANGPAARATIGAAAFAVYDDLVGGTDTISNTTWRSDAMSAGTPYTVTNGDLIAICFHLDTTAGTPSVKVRCQQLSSTSSPYVTSYLSAAYAAVAVSPCAVLVFDDGTLGWIEGSWVATGQPSASANIGNTNVYGNIFTPTFNCKIDALGAYVTLAGNTSDYELLLIATPLGTPSILATISVDANHVTSARQVYRNLATEVELTRNTAYCVGVRQTTANNLTVQMYDVSTATHLRVNGFDENCYAATSTALSTFAAANSGKRRYLIGARVSAIDDGAGGGTTIAGTPMLRGMV